MLSSTLIPDVTTEGFVSASSSFSFSTLVSNIIPDFLACSKINSFLTGSVSLL